MLCQFIKIVIILNCYIFKSAVFTVLFFGLVKYSHIHTLTIIAEIFKIGEEGEDIDRIV